MKVTEESLALESSDSLLGWRLVSTCQNQESKQKGCHMWLQQVSFSGFLNKLTATQPIMWKLKRHCYSARWEGILYTEAHLVPGTGWGAPDNLISWLHHTAGPSLKPARFDMSRSHMSVSEARTQVAAYIKHSLFPQAMWSPSYFIHRTKPIFYNNHTWDITFKNCDSLCCTLETYIIMYIN